MRLTDQTIRSSVLEVVLGKFTGKRGFTLIEIMIVVLLISTLLAIAVPYFAKARDNSRGKACVGNMRKLADAKDELAIESNKANGDSVGWDDVVPVYVKQKPECPSGGDYSLLTIGETVDCSTVGHDL